MFGTQRLVMFTTLAGLLSSGCDGNVLFASNVALTSVPCLLLWITVNLQKSR